MDFLIKEVRNHMLKLNETLGRTCVLQQEFLQTGKQSDWLDLPQDILFFIFLKLNTFDILIHAQFVCSSWQKLSKDPQLFSTINLPMKNNYNWNLVTGNIYAWYTRLGKEAVDRSGGELVEFRIERCCTEELLHYVVDKSKMLRSLQLVSCFDIKHVPTALASKHTFLEELEIVAWNVSKEVINDVGRSCLHLKRLIFGCGLLRSDEYRDLPRIIAENMPQLLALRLSRLDLTNDDLQIILDRCTALESLDIGNCYLSEVDMGLLKKCVGKIKVVRLPDSYKLN